MFTWFRSFEKKICVILLTMTGYALDNNVYYSFLVLRSNYDFIKFMRCIYPNYTGLYIGSYDLPSHNPR